MAGCNPSAKNTKQQGLRLLRFLSGASDDACYFGLLSAKPSPRTLYPSHPARRPWVRVAGFRFRNNHPPIYRRRRSHRCGLNISCMQSRVVTRLVDRL